MLLTPFEIYAGIDENINNFLEPFSKLISRIVFYSLSMGSTNVELIVIWLILGGLFCTFYFKFINIRFQTLNIAGKGEILNERILRRSLAF